MALNFSSHWRSAREESAEKPLSTDSSAFVKRLATRKKTALTAKAKTTTRRMMPDIVPPERTGILHEAGGLQKGEGRFREIRLGYSFFLRVAFRIRRGCGVRPAGRLGWAIR